MQRPRRQPEPSRPTPLRPCADPLAYREKPGAKTVRSVKSTIRSAGRDAAANADRQKTHPAETRAPPPKCSQTNQFIPLLAEYRKAPVHASMHRASSLRPIRTEGPPARRKIPAPPARLRIAPGSPSMCRHAQQMRRARCCRVDSCRQHSQTPHSSGNETPACFHRPAARQVPPRSRLDAVCT